MTLKTLSIKTLLAYVVALNCPATNMVNETEYPWNEFDYKTLHYAKKRCGELYESAPCVKLFKKWGKKDYSVICGEETE